MALKYSTCEDHRRPPLKNSRYITYTQAPGEILFLRNKNKLEQSWVILRNPRAYSNKIQVLLQKDLAHAHVCLKKAATKFYSLCSFLTHSRVLTKCLDCIYCPQSAELLCDSSNSASTVMPELKGKEFEYPDARLFLAITRLGPDGVMRLCPLYSGLEPEESSSV